MNEHNGSVSRTIPGFAKKIIIFQTAIILFFLFWLFEEYSNNLYFQTYVSNFFQGNTFTTIVLISITAFTVVAVFLYLRLTKTRRELERLLSRGKEESSGVTQGLLDNRTEQHLIEMIRKTQPIMNSGASSGEMPVLRRSRSPEEEPSQ